MRAKSLSLWVLMLGFAPTLFEAQTPRTANSRIATPRVVKKSDALMLFNELQNKNDKEVKDLIIAANVLLKKKIPKSQRDTLLINRANYYITLTRLDLLRSKTLELSTEGRETLRIAERDTAELALIPNQTQAYKAKVSLLKGLIALYKNESFEPFFLQSLQEDPRSSTAPWTSLMLAEFYFEKEDYPKAQSFYKRYFTKYDPKQQELAVYKLAWCAINLKEYLAAEKYFVQLVKKRNKSDIAKDALKDLGYVMSIHRTDKEIIAVAQSTFFDNPTTHFNFLLSIMSYREARQELKPNSLFFPAISKLEGFEAAKFQIFLSSARSSAKEYASHEHLYAFWAAQKNYTTKLDAAAHNSYMLETEKIIKSFYETYTGKVKTPETWTKTELNKELQKLLDFHIGLFPLSKARLQVIAAKTELCNQVKDYRCMLDAQQRILEDVKLKDRHEEATLETLKIWNDLYTKDPKKYRSFAIQAAVSFIRKYPKSKGWELSARRLSEYYMDAGEVADAANLMDDVYSRFPSPENFWRLQNTRFKAGQFAALLADTRLVKPEARILDLRREAALQKAIQDKASGRNDDYEKSIETFLDSNPDQEKARIARIDYFSNLIERKNFDKFQQVWVKLSAKERSHRDYTKILGLAWVAAFKNAQHQSSLALLPNTANAETLYLKLLNQISLNRNISFQELKSLEESKRLYLESLLLISAPNNLWAYFQSAKVRNSSERSLAAWSYRLNTGSMDIPNSSNVVNVLGPNYSYVVPYKNLATLQKTIQDVRIPNAQMSIAVFSKLLPRSLEDTRFMRRKVANALKVMQSPEQEIISIQMAELEQKMGDAIVQSPVPPQMQGPELEQYKAALAEAADEFLKQAIEFKKIAESAKQQKKVAEIPVPKDSSWPLSDTWSLDTYKVVRSLSSSGNYAGALAVLDMLTQENKVDRAQYYRMRLNTLRPIWEKSPILRQYLAVELKEVNQLQLLEEWRNAPYET